MPDSISWSISAGATSGVGLSSNGSINAEAATAASVSLDANMAGQEDLALQIAAVDKVAFFAVDASISDGTVEIQADGATATKLRGPLVLIGDAVGLFASDLSTLKVQNKHATEPATLTVMIGRNLSP